VTNHEDACPLSRFQQPIGRESRDRFANDGPADVEGFCELGLRRQLLSDGDLACKEVLAEGVGDPFRELLSS